MSNRIGPRFKYLEQPIFCLCTLKDYVLIASGGGGQKFGVRNKIISYRIINNQFSDNICHSVEFEKEIPVFISSFEHLNIFCTCVDNVTIFYKLDTSTGVFIEIYKLKVIDYYDADIYQSVCKFDNKGIFFAGGTTDGILKIWNLNTNRGNQSINPTLIKETQAHLKGVNDIAFIDDKNLVITAGADGCCKISEISSLKMLKKLTFRINISEKSNYSVRGLRYDNYSGILYTIQAPMRGHTYLTKWNARNNFEPVSTIKVSTSICTSMDFSRDYNLLGLADCNGSVIYVDASNDMSIIKSLELSEITIKSVAFKNGNLITGSADNALQLNYIYKPNFISFSFLLKLFFILIFGYYIYLRVSNQNNLLK